MKLVDLPDSSRMTALMELTQTLRNCQSPYEALLMYIRYLRYTNPGRAHVVLSTAGLLPGQYKVWRFLSDDGVENIEPCNPWENLNLPIYAGGNIARIIQNPTPHLVHDLDWSGDPHFAETFAPYRSLIAVPLFNPGLPLNWSIVLAREADYFTPTHLEESVMRATLIGSLLGSLHVTRELASANALIEADLTRMARIQRALLPDPIPDIPGLHLAASYETFGQVGGDLYDFIAPHKDTDPWCIFIGDASGHGPSAAVVAAMVQATLHDLAHHSAGPADLLQMLNHRLCQKRIEGSFVTAFLAFYNASTRQLRYASAGHPAPLLTSIAGQQTKFLSEGTGLPLGISDRSPFDETKIDLSPGQTLVLYTDGISEARAPDGSMFGSEGIERSLHNCGNNAAGVIDQLGKSLAAHQLGRRPNDDQTAVAIRVENQK